MLGVKKVYSSPINLGGGSVKTKHGILPVPAPATAEILGGVPVYSTDMLFELTTPTGAAILKELSSGFGGIPPMNITNTGLALATEISNTNRIYCDYLLVTPLNFPTPPFEKGGKGGF